VYSIYRRFVDMDTKQREGGSGLEEAAALRFLKAVKPKSKDSELKKLRKQIMGDESVLTASAYLVHKFNKDSGRDCASSSELPADVTSAMESVRGAVAKVQGSKRKCEPVYAREEIEETYAMKPMNCPAHCLMFKSRVRSWRDLPIRYGDFGVLHRNELKGALTGLTRVRRFQQDDGHIFCMPEQIENEMESCLDFVKHTYAILGFEFQLKLSTRPDKYLGDIELWDKAEAQLARSLDKFKAATGKDWTIDPGDGAFYGPKIDITVFDALKRKHQCATIQLDFQLPQRFDLTYTSGDENNRFPRPVIIHRAILGSVERMFAILIEHTGGMWPLWLSPRQIMVVPIAPKYYDYANKVKARFHELAFYIEVDDSKEKLNKKIRNAQIAHWNYIFVVGEEEENNGTVNVRTRDNKVHGVRSMADVTTHLVDMRSTRARVDPWDADSQQALGA